MARHMKLEVYHFEWLQEILKYFAIYSKQLCILFWIRCKFIGIYAL